MVAELAAWRRRGRSSGGGDGLVVEVAVWGRRWAPGARTWPV
jgi:hypothetical protein